MATEVRTLVLDDSGELVPVGGCGIQFSRDRHVQGVIELRVGGVRVLRREEIDTIDVLWPLPVTYIWRFMGGQDVKLPFPERRYIFLLKGKSGRRIAVEFDDMGEKRTGVDRRGRC